MTRHTFFSDEVFVPLLMEVLDAVELHKVAGNGYAILSKLNHLVITFLTFPEDVVVYLKCFGIGAVNGGKLDLSSESKQKILQLLETRKQSNAVKRLNTDDFDRLLNALKDKYMYSSKEKLDSINTDFVHDLIYAFSAIPGKRDYISPQECEKLKSLLRRRYAVCVQQKLNQQERQKGS